MVGVERHLHCLLLPCAGLFLFTARTRHETGGQPGSAFAGTHAHSCCPAIALASITAARCH
jgi:hypothetical protein